MIQEIDRVTGHDAIICTDVGQHQMWATQYYTFTYPRQFVSSGGLGTMGFGLPASIGAKIGNPDKTVIDISGDGGFQMTMQELATAVSYDVPVVVCILNNGYLGMVRQWQDLFWNKRYSFTCIDSSDCAACPQAPACTRRGRQRAARLQAARRSLRRRGHDGHGEARDRAGAARGDRLRPADGHRLQDVRRGERVPHGPGRSGDHGDDRRSVAARKEEAVKHTLSILVENKPGVLTRVAGLFARRGFNIESLAVGLSEDQRFSRITIVIDGDEHPVDQVTKQLHKLINVLKIRDLDPDNQVSAELLLVRVAGEGEKRTEALQIAEIFNAKIVDVDRRQLTLRVVGTNDKVEALLELLQPLGVLEVVRTGTIAMGRGRG